MINRKHKRKQIAECFKNSKCENRNFETLKGFEDFCYLAEINNIKTWNDAQQACVSRKSNLFKPGTEEEGAAIVEFLTSLGIDTEEGSNSKFHIGLRNNGA